LRAAPPLWPPIALAAAGLTGCFSTPRETPRTPPAPAAQPPAAAQAMPDAVPRAEPRSRYGNPAFYEVFGKRYYVLASSANYVERGVASWYGPGFHKERTSTGEPYDMYGMTAAHKTLPLPAYVRVTNLQNGRSVTVRVNDRGPFVGNRIIDLSYTAASRLDMLRNGTAIVEVRAVDPAMTSEPALPLLAASRLPGAAGSGGAASGAAASTPSMPAAAVAPAAAVTPVAAVTTPPSSAAVQPAAEHAPLFVQAGAFADPANAERLAAKLRGGGYGKILVRDDTIAGRRMYRVRIGPVPDVPEFDHIVAALEQAGVHDAHLAMD
jgi:rare lipoprotein A